MTTGIDRLQLSHRRAIQRRYDEDQRRMALAIALLLYHFQRNGSLPTDMQTRLMLKGLIWAQVLRPYYIGNGTEPFVGPDPQSPFATLVRDGIEGAMRIQVKRSVSLLKRYIKDELLLNWFLASRIGGVRLPDVRQANYRQPFWSYTDPNGYKINDRILRNSIDARAKLDRMLDFHILDGMDASTLGGAVANFMTISGWATSLRRRAQSYGDYGSYAPWKMLRGEMLVSAGRATIVASLLNPVVDLVQWRLGAGHAKVDECDDKASGGQNGDGVYPVNAAPMFPSHANCRCSLWPIAGDSADGARERLTGLLAAGGIEAYRLRGSMNEDRLTRALMTDEVGIEEPV